MREVSRAQKDISRICSSEEYDISSQQILFHQAGAGRAAPALQWVLAFLSHKCCRHALAASFVCMRGRGFGIANCQTDCCM